MPIPIDNIEGLTPAEKTRQAYTRRVLGESKKASTNRVLGTGNELVPNFEDPTYRRTGIGEFGAKLTEGQNKPKAISTTSMVKPQTFTEGAPKLTEGQTKPKATSTTSMVEPQTPTEKVPRMTTPTEGQTKPKAIYREPTKVEEAPPGEKHNTNLAELTDIVMKMARGELTDDIYQKSLNNYISNIALYHQADIEAINQQIAQDPNLRGTGLGYALLAQASREANFDVSNQLSKLSMDSTKRLLEMQKFGIRQGIDIDTINDERRRADIQSMANMGQWDAVADMMNESLAQTFPGLELGVSKESLVARDPFTREKFNLTLGNIIKIAKTDPDTAVVMVQNLMNDPTTADLFGEGMTAESFVEAIVTGQIEQAQTIVAPAYTAINSEAAINGSYYDVQDQYKILSDNGRRKGFIEAGKGLSLERVNELRMSEGLPEWDPATFESASLNDDEMEELGQLDHFYRTKTESKSQTKREALVEALKDTSFFADWLKNDDQEALDALYGWADMIEFNPNVYVDESGQVVFEGEDVNLPWLQRENYHIFYDWPVAFDDNGNELPPENIYWGNRVLTPELKTGLSDKKKLKDDELDEKWQNYLAANGTLSAREWYFASAGGKYKINEEGFNENRIPLNLKNKSADLPDETPEELPPVIPPTITKTFTVDDIGDGGLTENDKGIETEFGTFITPALPPADGPSKVYETLRQNAGKIEIPPGAEARNLEDIISLMKQRVEAIDRSERVAQDTRKKIVDWTREVFSSKLGIDLNTYIDIESKLFNDARAGSGAPAAYDIITREGRAMEMFLMMVKDLNMDADSAYAMAANLIGTDRLDAAFKQVTGKTYSELKTQTGEGVLQ